MKLIINFIFILLTMILPVPAGASRHVVLICIDALCPEMYLDPAWPSPNLQRLMHEGTYAPYMRSIFPANTYPAHSSMVTGELPARTGIAYNAPEGSRGEWNWFLKGIEARTLWQMVASHGLTSAAVQWPVSVGEGITWNVPEIWPASAPEDRISESRKYATPGLVEEIELNATGRLDHGNMNEEFLSMDANAARMAAYIFKKYRPNLLALHFASVDGMGHGYGRNASQVRLALANADNGVGVVLEAVERSGLKDSTTVIVVGDHGMSTIHSAVRPNIWIKDLKARFLSAGGSCFLHLDNPGDEASLRAVRKRLEELDVKYRGLFRIYEKSELEAEGADRDAVLALVAKKGYTFSGTDTGRVTFPVNGGQHGYHPDEPEMHTGFIACGPGVGKGRRSPLRITDIAPLVAKLLGVDAAAGGSAVRSLALHGPAPYISGSIQQEDSQKDSPAKYTLTDTVRAVAGGTFTVNLKFTTEEGWYIYAPTGNNAAQGMIETNLICLPPKGITRSGRLQFPEPHFKGGFEVLEGREICLKQSFMTEEGLAPGKYVIKTKITYQSCCSLVCMTPVTDEREIVVLLGSGSSSSLPKVKQ